MGTLMTFLPSERMMLSSLTMSARFFLIASRIFCLWRSWSTAPLRCSDQSCCETVDVEMGIAGTSRAPVRRERANGAVGDVASSGDTLDGNDAARAALRCA